MSEVPNAGSRDRLVSMPGVLALLAATVLMLGLFEWGNHAVYPHGAGVEGMPTILDLHLSFTEPNFRHVLERWSGEACAPAPSTGAECVVPAGVERFPDGVSTWKRNTVLLDYLFPLVYASFFVAALVWLWRPGGRSLRLLVLGGAVSAGADFVENSLHLWVLRDVDAYSDLAGAQLSSGAIWAASAFSSVKWGLIALALVGIAVGAVVRLSSWVRER